MKKLKITYDKPITDELVDRVGELVDNWNTNADYHFGIASDIGDGSFSNESRETLLLKFVHADILDTIDDYDHHNWENNSFTSDARLFNCGRSGSHVWLHSQTVREYNQGKSPERILMISYPDPGEEDLDPLLEWKYMKWVFVLIILMLLVKLVNNLLI